jgi:predicted secreted Zn-dependent protease
MRFRNFVITAAATAIAVLVGALWLPTPFDHTPATAQVANPKITLTNKYYAVRGETADQIRRHLNQVGPFVSGACHFGRCIT